MKIDAQLAATVAMVVDEGSFEAAARRMHVTQDFEGKDFIVFRSGRWHATPLLLTLIVVETTDVMFAFDSIPAVFSVTKDSFIVFTSNVFAVLTMRSLYFALRGTVDRFRYLKPALALLLVIIGLKIVAERFIEIPVWATLGVTVGREAGPRRDDPVGDAAVADLGRLDEGVVESPGAGVCDHAFPGDLELLG